MEIILLLVIVVILIIVLNKQQRMFLNFFVEIRDLSFKIDELKKQLHSKNKALSDSIDMLIDKNNTVSSDKIIKEKFEETIPKDISDAVAIQESIDEHILEKVEVESQIQDPIVEQQIITESILQNDALIKQDHSLNQSPIISDSISEQSVYEPKKSWFQKFKEKNPDLEKFIGENLINKIGILILVLGISFFVKYAIDKDWINEPARVGIGILAGTLVMAVAHKLRKDYTSFSSVFVGGALSIYYLTIGIAFHDYALFSQTTAFIIMVFITIFGALVSVSYNRKELAIIALIGGFAVPFMVSTGQGNYQVLFSYIILLNVGMLVISYLKKWNVITLLAFISTTIIYSGWFTIEFNTTDFPYQGALLFTTIFYIIFSLATVINNVGKELNNSKSFTKLDYFIMLGNTLCYFTIGAIIFSNWHTEFKGVFTLSLAIYNLILSVYLNKKLTIKKDIIYLFLGLTLTFITLTIPFQFSGNYITLFWACEAVLLLWLSQKSKIATFRIGGIAVLILMFLSLFIDWEQAYASSLIQDLTPLMNKIFLTGLLAVGSLIAIYYLLRKETENTTYYFISINPKLYRKFAAISGIILAYFVGAFELIYQINLHFVNSASILSYSVVFHYVFVSILAYFLFKNSSKSNNIIAFVLLSINVVFYIVVFHNLSYKEILYNLSNNYDSNSAYIGHFVLLICTAYSIFALIKNQKRVLATSILQKPILLWIFSFCVIFVLSNEIIVHTLYYSVNYVKDVFLSNNQSLTPGEYLSVYSKETLYNIELSAIKKRVVKIGFPILWGLISFVFLIVGIKKQIKQLRIIALTLLGITIAKLFIFDMNVSGPGRIVAFILLGMLILIISFVYQKLNKKVINETKKDTDETHI